MQEAGLRPGSFSRSSLAEKSILFVSGLQSSQILSRLKYNCHVTEGISFPLLAFSLVGLL